MYTGSGGLAVSRALKNHDARNVGCREGAISFTPKLCVNRELLLGFGVRSICSLEGVLMIPVVRSEHIATGSRGFIGA